MPRSSRHKSHRHSKHSSRDAREYSESEEDAKMRDFNKEEGSTRVPRNSGSSDKRKDPPSHSNGDVGEEYLGSKRTKEKDKEKGNVVSDRWTGGGGSGVVVESEMKGESLKSKSGVDSKSKSSGAHDNSGDKRDASKSEGKVESKRKHEKESKEKVKVSEKEKEKEKEKERKGKDNEREVEDEVVDIGDAAMSIVGFDKEQEGRHGRENNVWPIQDERNPESEKERKRKRDGSNERDKYHDDVKISGDRRVYSKGERTKDVKYKDEKHKDKYREDIDRNARYKDEKYEGDVDRERKYRDAMYKDEKYEAEVDRERRYRDAKYRDSVDKVSRHKDDRDRYREDVDTDKRLRDDKYKHRDAKYREDAEKDYRRRVDKYHDDGDKEDKYRDDWYFEDSTRDGRHREGKQRGDSVKDKRGERHIRDETNENSDPKRSRDESEAAEFRHKRLNIRDGSPNFDDRGARYKDDGGKRRNSDKEDYGDVKIWSSKEQHFDVEKKYENSGRLESVGNRGRSTLRDTDIVISPNHGRRGDSPSYRVIKPEESRYREYTHGGRERRDITPAKEYVEKVSRSNERSIHKYDGFGDDGLKEDAPFLAVHMVDRSPSSASNDRRNLTRADVRRSLDVEDSDQRSGGSKEIKDYRIRDNSDFPTENLPGNEIPRADNDNISKPNHFNNSNRSLLPPTPFRGGPDRPFDDENRGNKQNRRRRMNPNMGNAWRGMPNWPSPVANGFVPFQQCPPPLGFHPVMHQFPNTSIFGVRPSMELNQSGLPFQGHVHNSIFGDESQLYGRLDWDHNRNFNGGRGWENSRDSWKGQNSSMNADLINKPDKVEDWPTPTQTDTKQLSVEVESVGVDPLSDVVERVSPKEASKAIPNDVSDLETIDDDYFSRAYLSMLDISEDLSQFELYSQCTNLVGLDQSTDPNGDDSKIVIMEEDIDALGKDSSKNSSASLFSTMNDLAFQKAMSMYYKLKEEVTNFRQDKAPSTATNDEQTTEAIPAVDQYEPKISILEPGKVEIEPSLQSPIEVNMGSINDNNGKFVPLPFAGTSAEVGIEGVNDESGSVNVSRRLQSPQSTH